MRFWHPELTQVRRDKACHVSAGAALLCGAQRSVRGPPDSPARRRDRHAALAAAACAAALRGSAVARHSAAFAD